MRKKILMVALVVCCLSIPSTCSSYDVINFPSSIRTPEQLANWLSREFTYEFKFPDYGQTVEETLSRRSGDCEDFAQLSQMILNNIGIKNDIVVIRFRQISILHAVCIFKYGDTYSFMSSRNMVRTKGRSIDEAITELFPDWDKIIYLAAGRQFGRTVDRGYAGTAGSSTLSAPSMYSSLLGPEQFDIGMIRFMIESKLNLLKRSGMRFGISTFMTIFKDSAQSHIRFLFNKVQLTAEGFRVPCTAQDKDGIRTYYALFSVADAAEGFTMTVYPENDWKRVNQFNNIIPHPAA